MLPIYTLTSLENGRVENVKAKSALPSLVLYIRLRLAIACLLIGCLEGGGTGGGAATISTYRKVPGGIWSGPVMSLSLVMPNCDSSDTR